MEKRKKIVEVDVFISFDGKEFDTEAKYIHYEAIQKGERMVCPNCRGLKGSYEHDGFGDTKWFNCSKCNGRGYLELKWT